MNIEDLKRGDVVCSTDSRGTGYYRVLKVNKITVDVVGENGNKVRSYPAMFDRKIDYHVPTLPEIES